MNTALHLLSTYLFPDFVEIQGRREAEIVTILPPVLTQNKVKLHNVYFSYRYVFLDYLIFLWFYNYFLFLCFCIIFMFLWFCIILCFCDFVLFFFHKNRKPSTNTCFCYFARYSFREGNILLFS